MNKTKLKLSVLTSLFVISSNLLADSQSKFDDLNNSLLTYDSNIKVYGTNQKNLEKTYSGAGIEFNNDFALAGFEYGRDYTKIFGVYKYDFTEKIYGKIGLGFLEKEMLILDENKDVKQNTIATALGYGNNSNYNFEGGYMIYTLSNAAAADGNSYVTYAEVILKDTFGEYLTFDITGVIKNSNVFNENYVDIYSELGWFPLDNTRLYTAYDSVDYDSNNYIIKAGIQYTFGKNAKLSPFLIANSYISTNTSIGLEYSNNLINKPLSMRDTFERSISTIDIIAQKIAPEVFAQKTTKASPVIETNDAPTGKNLTFNANYLNTYSIDLSSHIQDINGDALTLIYVGSGVSSGDIIIDNTQTGITGTTATITVSNGTGNGYIDYKVSDGVNTSQTYRITINHLDGV